MSHPGPPSSNGNHLIPFDKAEWSCALLSKIVIALWAFSLGHISMNLAIRAYLCTKRKKCTYSTKPGPRITVMLVLIVMFSEFLWWSPSDYTWLWAAQLDKPWPLEKIQLVPSYMWAGFRLKFSTQQNIRLGTGCIFLTWNSTQSNSGVGSGSSPRKNTGLIVWPDQGPALFSSTS